MLARGSVNWAAISSYSTILCMKLRRYEGNTEVFVSIDGRAKSLCLIYRRQLVGYAEIRKTVEWIWLARK
jgi:hypothetical protein